MKSYLALMALVWAVCVGFAGDPFESAVNLDDVDFEASCSFTDGERQGVKRQTLINAMALERITGHTEHWHRNWTAGGQGGARAGTGKVTYHYLVALKRPITVGSVLYTTQRLAVLKPGAPYPGDPANPEHWLQITSGSSGEWKLAALPLGTTTRAVLLTSELVRGRSSASPIRLYSKRLHNISSEALARAKSFYQAPDNFGAKSFPASNPVRGNGAWVSVGKDDKGQVRSPFVSDVQPTWYAVAWDEPKALAGVIMVDNFSEFSLQYYAGQVVDNPLVGVDSEWIRVKDALVAYKRVHVRSDKGRWIAFDEPYETRSLRFHVRKTWTGPEQAASRSAEIEDLLLVTDLGDQPVPATGGSEVTPPPMALSWTLPETRYVTIAINDQDGHRVRNLLARRLYEAGRHEAHWDLKDESGAMVKPGAYTWKMISHPPLKLRYQFSIYPNVSQHHPESTAWLNGHEGPGGWLADHSMPFGAATDGDRLFFSATVPESGVGFASTDLSGKKLWGIHSFSNWSGGRKLAADGGKVYVEQFGNYQDETGMDRIWEVDVATQKVQQLMAVKSDERRARGISGIAARDGKVFLSVNAKQQWLSNATGQGSVDIARCMPAYPPARKPRFPYEIVPNPQLDFMRLLRLTGNPPGYNRGHGLTYLESTRGPDRKQWLMVSFTKPAMIGSCVFPVPQKADYKVKLSVLKENAPYPPDPEKPEHWQDFSQQATLAWDVAVAPENCRTRALLVTFYKGVDDELGDLLGDELGGPAWEGRLEGMQMLRRRYQNHFAEASVTVSSGDIDPEGVWVAERDKPLTASDPEWYMMSWDQARPLRGLAIKEIDCSLAEIDVWTGAGAPDPADAAGWEQVGSYVPKRRMQHPGFAGHNALARYMDDTVDFGATRETRGVRIRVVAQWQTEIREGSCAKDELGIDTSRCRLFGVAPLEYVGGEFPVDATAAQRLEVFNPTTRTIEQEVAIQDPADLTFGPNGDLYVLSGNRVVKAGMDGNHVPVVTDLLKPTALATGPDGAIYVFDADAGRKQVRVYDRTGQLVRTVGEPGGHQVGPWNPNRMERASAMVVDRENKLWVVDQTYWPKRVSCWSGEGAFLRDYIGPTEYGGAGILNPWDKRQFFYGPMEFELDWEAGTSRLKNLTWSPAHATGREAGEMPIKLGDRLYMVTRPQGSRNAMPVGIVYLHEGDRLRVVAAMGLASAWSTLKQADFAAATNGVPLPDLQFLFVDRDGDGVPEPDEVEFAPLTVKHLTRFNRDLGVQAGAWRYQVKGFLANGVPDYELVKVDELPHDDDIYRLRDGRFYVRGNGEGNPDQILPTTAHAAWTYANEGAGVGPDRSCQPFHAEQVVCQFCLVGHEVAEKGDLGEFFVYNTNLGGWNLWTADGLLAGRIFRDLRDRERVPWTMMANDRGMNVDNITTGQEHFQGWLCRTDDGRYYAVAGHNHASIVEVIGLDNFTRDEGAVEVTTELIRETQAWASQAAMMASRQELKVYDVSPMVESITIDGDLGDWRGVQSVTVNDELTFRMVHSKQGLYASWDVQNRANIFENQGKQRDKLFKTGAAVDLMIGCDPTADPDRRAPVAGDMRLLIAPMDGKPVAMIYNAVVEGADPALAWKAVSPVGEVTFDVVKSMPQVKVAVQKSDRGFVVEALIPYSATRLTMAPELRVKFDWGVLESVDGKTVQARTYWANKATSTLADVPSEARLHPNLWGYAIFQSKTSESVAPRLPGAVLDGPSGNDDLDFSLEER